MRTFLIVLLVVGAVYSSPVDKVKRQTDFETIDPFPGADDVDDDDDFMDGKGFFSSNFFDYFRQMTRFMNQFFNRPFFGQGGFGTSFGDVDNLPPNYDNSTFTTKVVNGTIITVNETIQKHQTNDSSFVWQVKVVEVRPENATSSEEEGSTDIGERSSQRTPELFSSDNDAENDVAPAPKVVRRNAPSKIERSQV